MTAKPSPFPNTGTAALSVSAIALPERATACKPRLPLNIAVGDSATLRVSGYRHVDGGGAVKWPDEHHRQRRQQRPLRGQSQRRGDDPGAGYVAGWMAARQSSTAAAMRSPACWSAPAIRKTFTVSNTGTAALSVSAITLPDGLQPANHLAVEHRGRRFGHVYCRAHRHLDGGNVRWPDEHCRQRRQQRSLRRQSQRRGHGPGAGHVAVGWRHGDRQRRQRFVRQRAGRRQRQ